MAELVDIRKEYRTLYELLMSRIDSLQDKIDATCRTRHDDCNKFVEQLSEITKNIIRLGKEINEHEQEELQCDLEIGHVPESQNENLVNLMIVIGEKLGVPINENNIVYAMRSGIRWGREPHPPGRSRRIAVRLASRLLRDSVLEAARARHHITTADIGLPGYAERIYFNERLTQMNRRLFHQARNECRSNGWRYLWIKHGRILVRQDDGTHVYAIRNEANIERVFEVGLH